MNNSLVQVCPALFILTVALELTYKVIKFNNTLPPHTHCVRVCACVRAHKRKRKGESKELANSPPVYHGDVVAYALPSLR